MKKSTKTTAKAAPCVKPACAKESAKKAAASKKKSVQFTLHTDAGKAVCVAGTFNGWDPQAKKMSFKAGVYTATVRLAPGTYEYKFVVDGQWMADPECADFVPNDQGTFNSVLTVK